MSTSILLDQNFNAKSVDKMIFEPSVLFSPAAIWGIEGPYKFKNFTKPCNQDLQSCQLPAQENQQV